MSEPVDLHARVVELRRAFDDGFAVAVRGDLAGDTRGDVLAIRVAGDPYALRLGAVASLHADPRVVPLPSPVPSLRGLVGVRNAMVPVYDLAMLLGYPRAASPRWLILARAAPVGLAFETFDAHARTSAAGDVVEIDGVARPVIDLAQVVDDISRRASRPRQEP